MSRLKGWMRERAFALLFGDEAGPGVYAAAMPAAPASAGEAEASAPADAGPAAVPEHELSDLEERLGQFFKSIEGGNRRVSAGKLQILDLGGLRERLGDSWKRGGELVHQLASGVIRHHLGPSDVMARHRDDSYIVLFARLSAEEAQLKAKVIGDEIAERVLGASGGKHAVRIKSVVAHVDGSVALEELDGEALIEKLMAEAEAQFAELEGEDAEDESAFDQLDRQFRPVFSPVWYAPKSVVSANLCQIAPRDGVEDAERDDDTAAGEALDHFALRHGVGRLVDTLARDRVEVVILPVHYQTLMEPVALSRYLDAMSKVPEDCRPLICHEVLRMPPEIAPTRFNEVMATLRQHSRAVLCRVALDFRGFRLIDPPAVHAVGVHLHYYAGEEVKLLQRMQTFARDADARGLKPYVLGLRNRSQIMAALGAGFTYLHGAQIKVEHGGLAEFGLADLYAS